MARAFLDLPQPAFFFFPETITSFRNGKSVGRKQCPQIFAPHPQYEGGPAGCIRLMAQAIICNFCPELNVRNNNVLARLSSARKLNDSSIRFFGNLRSSETRSYEQCHSLHRLDEFPATLVI